MGRLVTSGAETNDRTIEGYTLTGSVTNQTSVVRSGSRAYSIAATLADASWAVPGGAGRAFFARVAVRLSAIPNGANNDRLFTFYDSGLGEIASVVVPSGGTGEISFSGSTTGFFMEASRWYVIEISVNAANTVTTLRVDGVQIATGSATFGGASGIPATFAIGSKANSDSAVTNYFDDIAINDDQGANQNTWPGDGKVVLLIPTADSAVGTGWTLGTGTAISGGSGSTAVKNTPPVGVADLAAGSDPKQIRNATSNANVNYDGTMTTYSAAGIGPNDQVNVIDPIVATAAPVVTQAKAGTVGVASNPAIANVALGAGGTAGAFWSGTAGGTYPTGWKISHGTLTYAPSVTLGTSPVMRITQVTSSTRIADVCFMGMYVDYTPGALGKIKTILQAVRRSTY